MQGDVRLTKADYAEIMRKEYAQRLIVPTPLDENGFPVDRAALTQETDRE